MPFRVSILDLTAAIVVLVAIFLPDRGVNVVSAYEADRDTNHKIALYQAALAKDPKDAAMAARLSQLLIDVKQSDWAVQVASEAADDKRGDAWRALLAASMAHAERVEVNRAHEFAERALSACRQAGSIHCPVHEEARLAAYFAQLEAGAKSGIDPRIDPRGYEQAVLRSMIMVGPFRGATPDGDSSAPKDTSGGSPGDVSGQPSGGTDSTGGEGASAGDSPAGGTTGAGTDTSGKSAPEAAPDPAAR